MGALAFIGLQAVAGCSEVTCPEPLSNVDGACLKVELVIEAEPCDGVDNDGDTQVDEDWPELGQPCGEGAGIGECVEGSFVCAEGGTGVVCVGAVGPSDEVCDGKDNDCDGIQDNGPEEICDGEDNDCDGLVDEGVLSVKSEVFGDHASVTAVDGGFVVTRVVGNEIRLDTYDTSGDATGNFDVIESPTQPITFLASDGVGSRVLVALGRYSFYVLDIHVDSDLVPIILNTQGLHEDWLQFEDVGVYSPPFHPRVVASLSRFVGYRDFVSFALSSFSGDDLVGLTRAPTLAPEIPIITEFDVAGPFVAWKQDTSLRAGWLLDDGSLLSAIDVARGQAPSIALRGGAVAVAYLQDGRLRLSELGALLLLCVDGGFCNEGIDAEGLRELKGPTGLAYHQADDTWFVVAGGQLAAVGRAEDGPVVKQTVVLDALRGIPNRVEVEVSGGTAAIVHAEVDGQSGLTFLGCF